MKKEIFVLISMNTRKNLIATTSLKRLDSFLKEEWLQGEPENYKQLKKEQECLNVDIVRALQIIGYQYDITIERFEDDIEEPLKEKSISVEDPELNLEDEKFFRQKHMIDPEINEEEEEFFRKAQQ